MLKLVLKKDVVVFMLLIAVYCILQYKNLYLDFWNDELYTMEHFIFVPISTTVGDYHVPNNHIFFNLTVKAYTTILGIHSIHPLLEAPYVLRTLPFIFSLLSLFMVWKIGRRFFNPHIALLAVGCMITCIPFLNYSLQIRGYGLSILFVTLILYFYLAFVESRKGLHLFLICLFVALIMYTIPSNLLFLLSLGVLGMFHFFFNLKRTTFETGFFKAIFGNVYLKLNLSILIGVGVCLLFYVPIFKQVFYNEYVVSDVYKNSENGWQNFLQCSLYFLSNRYFLFILVVFGLILCGIKKFKLPFVATSFSLLFLYVVPFIISIIRRDNPPDRIYTNAIPMISLVLGILGNVSIETFIKSKDVQLMLISCILAMNIFICFQERHKIDSKLKQDLITGERSQNLYYNYFDGHYTPMKTLREFQHITNNKSILLIHDAEPHDIPVYLREWSVPFLDAASLDSVIASKPDEFYIITRYPILTQQEFVSKNYHYKFEPTDSSYTYHTLIKLVKVNDEK